MQIKNIVIDQGNYSFKIGVFEARELMDVVEYRRRKDVLAFVQALSPQYVLLSSVVRKNKKLMKAMAESTKVMRLTSKTPLPFKNLYASPKTLGPDRIAAIAAASEMFQNENCLVVDAGTCITYDFLDNKNVYQGGAISPGISMRFQALNHYTSRLPLVEKINNPDLIGNTTQSCIESGVVNGVLAEVEGIIEKYEAGYGNIKVVLCGGDVNFFESNLKGHIFAVANFVLLGLNRILLYNIDNFESLQ